MPLGSLLGPLEALLGGLKSEKMQTVPRENHFFENVAFLVFEAPDAPLGLILAASWANLVTKRGSKMGCKSGPKNLKTCFKSK